MGFQEANVEHEHLIHQSLTIDQNLLNYLNMNLSSSEELKLNLRCGSIQHFPNGSIIYESSTSQTFNLIRGTCMIDFQFFLSVNTKFVYS